MIKKHWGLFMASVIKNLFNFATSVSGYVLTKGADSFVSNARNSFAIFGLYANSSQAFSEANAVQFDRTRQIKISLDAKINSGTGNINYIGLAQYNADKSHIVIKTQSVASTAMTGDYQRITVTLSDFDANTVYGILAFQAANGASSAVFEIKDIEITYA